MSVHACEACLARSWLLARLAGHLDTARDRLAAVLALPTDELLAAVGGATAGPIRREMADFDASAARAAAEREQVAAVCACDERYPGALRDLRAPPAVVYVAGDLERLLSSLSADAVAIVGARRASAYGLEVAKSLARALSGAGLAVISGMANGIDAAAHAGALSARTPTAEVDSDGSQCRPDTARPVGRTIAVLPASPARAYPAGQRALHRRILAEGAAISELPPGTSVRRWMFPARNRLIAALSAMTVVVEAGERSGSLVTAAAAAELGRPVGVVPGRINSPRARGSNAWLAAGAAHAVLGAQSVVDAIYGAGTRSVAASTRAAPPPALMPLLTALADGLDTGLAVARAGFGAQAGLAALAELELSGHIRRGPGGSYTVAP